MFQLLTMIMLCFWLIGCIWCLDFYQYGRGGWGICHVSSAIVTKLQLPPPPVHLIYCYFCVCFCFCLLLFFFLFFFFTLFTLRCLKLDFFIYCTNMIQVLNKQFQLPIETHDIIMFLSYLHDNGRKYGTLLRYLSAISFHLRMKSLSDCCSSFMVCKFMQGVKKSINSYGCFTSHHIGYTWVLNWRSATCISFWLWREIAGGHVFYYVFWLFENWWGGRMKSLWSHYTNWASRTQWGWQSNKFFHNLVSVI